MLHIKRIRRIVHIIIVNVPTVFLETKMFENIQFLYFKDHT